MTEGEFLQKVIALWSSYYRGEVDADKAIHNQRTLMQQLQSARDQETTWREGM